MTEFYKLPKAERNSLARKIAEVRKRIATHTSGLCAAKNAVEWHTFQLQVAHGVLEKLLAVHDSTP